VVLDAVFPSYIVVMVFYSWLLTLVVYGSSICLLTFILHLCGNRLALKQKRNAENLVEVVSGIQTVKAQI